MKPVLQAVLLLKRGVVTVPLAKQGVLGVAA
jgi:hypothetical protein